VGYTDGLVEQARDLDRGLLLLSETVRSVRGESARGISDAIAATIAINAPDDIAYAVIRRV
jgi:Stage II sporulation protein E (SpoIIE)